MPFIGNQPALAYTSFAVQHFTTSATTSYTLDYPVANENEIRLVINNVVQQPGSSYAYSATGTSLTLTSATTATDTMYAVFLGKAVQTVNPPAGSVGTSQLENNAVTSTKMFSGFANGITQADQWRISANHSGVGVVTTNWERVDNSGFNYIGTGMTQSSGIFTFPSTGIYFIQFNTMIRVTGGNTGFLASTINITLDNSSYSRVARAYSFVLNGQYTNAYCSFIFDVTSTANNKVQFELAQNEANTPLFLGSTDESQTYSTFIRLGDT